jgi:hypothetical protein
MHDQKILVTVDATIWEDHYKKEFVLPFGSQAVSFGVKPTEPLMMLSVPVPDLEDLSKFKQTRAIHENLQSTQQIMTVRTPEKESWCLQRYLVLRDNGTRCQHAHLDFGPFHIQFWWEFASPFSAGIKVSAEVPWVGTLDLASAEGDLVHGLTLDIGCPPYVTGSVTAMLKQEGMITIVFKADFLGQEWSQEFNIPFGDWLSQTALGDVPPQAVHGRMVMAGKLGTGKRSEITIAPPSQEDVGPLVRPSCLEGASVVMMPPQGQNDSVKCFIRKAVEGGEWQFNLALGPLRVVLGVHPIPPFEASVGVF